MLAVVVPQQGTLEGRQNEGQEQELGLGHPKIFKVRCSGNRA